MTMHVDDQYLGECCMCLDITAITERCSWPQSHDKFAFQCCFACSDELRAIAIMFNAELWWPRRDKYQPYQSN